MDMTWWIVRFVKHQLNQQFNWSKHKWSLGGHGSKCRSKLVCTTHVYKEITIETETSFYPNLTKFTRCQCVKLMDLKTINEWTSKNFTKLPHLLIKINIMQVLCPIDIIHAWMIKYYVRQSFKKI